MGLKKVGGRKEIRPKGRQEEDRGCESSLNDVVLKVQARSQQWQQPWRGVLTGVR